MWAIVLILTGVWLLLMALVHLWVSHAALRRAGIRYLNLRTPLRELPKPERRRLMHALRRRQVPAPEHRDVVRRWAGEELLRRGMSWSFVWLTLACGVLLAETTLDSGASTPFSYWTFMTLTVVCAVMAVLMWGNQITARRVLRQTDPFDLRDTPPPA